MGRLLVAAALLVHLSACDAITGFRWRMAIDRAEVASTPTVRLASVRRAGERGNPAIRVVVGDTVAVDNISLLRHYGVGDDAALYEVELDSLLVVAPGLPLAGSAEHGGFFLPSLYDAAAEVAELARRLDQWTGAAALPWTAEIWVDRGVTFGTLARVLYTLGQANFGDFSFVVGEGAVPVGSAWRACTPDPSVQQCAAPDLWLGLDGVTVAARATPRGGCGMLSLLGTLGDGASSSDLVGSIGVARGERTAKPKPKPTPKPKPEPAWAGRILTRAGGGCPSVPHVDGRVDAAGLATHLALVQALAPGCRRSVVSVVETVTWSEVAAMLAVLIVEREVTHAALAPGIAGPPGCAEAVSIDEVR